MSRDSQLSAKGAQSAPNPNQHRGQYLSAAQYKNQGRSVLVAAADTFRAAAIDQLVEWANRSNTDIIAQSEGSDPAAVVYDAVKAFNSRGTDILLCDTAGRQYEF